MRDFNLTTNPEQSKEGGAIKRFVENFYYYSTVEGDFFSANGIRMPSDLCFGTLVIHRIHHVFLV
jgi:hypothetical protein